MQAIMIVVVCALVTILLRALPFMLFSSGRKSPEIINYLGKVLPYAIMAMLVVYCLRNVSFVSVNGWLAQAISCLVVVLLHVWKRNSLISIVGGTVCYMLLIQLVF